MPFSTADKGAIGTKSSPGTAYTWSLCCWCNYFYVFCLSHVVCIWMGLLIFFLRAWEQKTWKAPFSYTIVACLWRPLWGMFLIDICQKAFSVIAPTLWNSLLWIHLAPSILEFYHTLTCFLFWQAFGLNVVKGFFFFNFPLWLGWGEGCDFGNCIYCMFLYFNTVTNNDTLKLQILIHMLMNYWAKKSKCHP